MSLAVPRLAGEIAILNSSTRAGNASCQSKTAILANFSDSATICRPEIDFPSCDSLRDSDFLHRLLMVVAGGIFHGQRRVGVEESYPENRQT